MPTFLLLLKEDDIAVKNVALLMVYSAVHHTDEMRLVTGLMKEQILPVIYELAQLNMERKVDLGPFKHTVDDALPLRKAALSIVATCLEKCPSCIDIPGFVSVLAKSMGDVEDVQLQTHQIVLSMCSRHPIPLVAAADSFVEPLEKTVNKKKGSKTGVSPCIES
jgi:cullin-associated NEDD8-dissociated protein 1